MVSVAFTNTGAHIISGSLDSTIRLWNTKTGSQLRQFKGHLAFVTSVAFSPDSTQVIATSSDKNIWLWNTDSGKHLRTYTGHWGTVTSASFSPAGDQIVSGSTDKTIKIWDTGLSMTDTQIPGLRKNHSIQELFVCPNGVMCCFSAIRSHNGYMGCLYWYFTKNSAGTL